MPGFFTKPDVRKPKGPTATARARKRRQQLAKERLIKLQVRVRDNGLCRVCGRTGESVHEIQPKGMGGSRTAVSMENSIMVCGDGIRGCHGKLQRHEIVVGFAGTLDANEKLFFYDTKSIRRAHIG